MKQVHISKGKLLEAIKNNREIHRREYEEAIEGWQVRVIDELRLALDKALGGEEYNIWFNLPKPDNHLDEYDAVIDQIEWHEADTIDLDIIDFNKYIRDDWGWKEDFLHQTAMYAKVKGGLR
jgi:hypothetical protein